jgi:hypothetical protein
MNWVNAIAACEGSTLAGYSDWRMPNIRELSTLVGYASAPPVYISPLFEGCTAACWSSTSAKPYTVGYDITNALYIPFTHPVLGSEYLAGSILPRNKTSSAAFAGHRAVRYAS